MRGRSPLSVRDAALMLNVLAATMPAIPGSADLPVPDYTASLHAGIAGMRNRRVQESFLRRQRGGRWKPAGRTGDPPICDAAARR